LKHSHTAQPLQPVVATACPTTQAVVRSSASLWVVGSRPYTCSILDCTSCIGGIARHSPLPAACGDHGMPRAEEAIAPPPRRRLSGLVGGGLPAAATPLASRRALGAGGASVARGGSRVMDARHARRGRRLARDGCTACETWRSYETRRQRTARASLQRLSPPYVRPPLGGAMESGGSGRGVSSGLAVARATAASGVARLAAS